MPTGDCGSMRIFRYNGAPDTIYNGRPAGEACEAVPFDPSAGFDNLTTFDLDYMYSLGQRILVVIRDNAVVSAAAASPCGGDRAELSVETADGYTGRGYASACAAALARMLHEEGVTALYLAQEDNPASHAAARKAGFGEAGGMYQLVCRKKTKRRKFRFRKFLV